MRFWCVCGVEAVKSLYSWHLPAHWSQLSLITSLQLWIHHWAPTNTYLLKPGSSNLDQWLPSYTPFIRFLCSRGMSNIALILLFAQYSWQQYSLNASLYNFDLSPGSGWTLHSFPRNRLLSHPSLPWGRITAFRHISGGAHSNFSTQDSIGSYSPTPSTVAPTILCASDGLGLCSLSSWENHPDYYYPHILSDFDFIANIGQSTSNSDSNVDDSV